MSSNPSVGVSTNKDSFVVPPNGIETLDDASMPTDLLDIDFFTATNEKISDLMRDSTSFNNPGISSNNEPVYNEPVIHDEPTYNPEPEVVEPKPEPVKQDTTNSNFGFGKKPEPVEEKKFNPTPLMLGTAVAAGAAIAYTVGKKKKNEE